MGRTVAQTAPKLTYDDFVLFPDDGKRHELVDGEHYVSPSPNLRHQRVLRDLGFLLHRFVEANGLGEDRLTSPLFPGLEIALAEVLAE